MFYTAQSGIWQTVWMEKVPECHIGHLKITPLYDQSSVMIQLEEAAWQKRYRLRSDGNGKNDVAGKSMPAGQGEPCVVMNTAYEKLESGGSVFI